MVDAKSKWAFRQIYPFENTSVDPDFNGYRGAEELRVANAEWNTTISIHLGWSEAGLI